MTRVQPTTGETDSIGAESGPADPPGGLRRRTDHRKLPGLDLEPHVVTEETEERAFYDEMWARRRPRKGVRLVRSKQMLTRQTEMLERLVTAVEGVTNSKLVKHILSHSGRGLLRLLVSPAAILPLRVAAGLLPLADRDAVAELRRRGLVHDLGGRSVVVIQEVVESLRSAEKKRGTLRALPRETL